VNLHDTRRGQNSAEDREGGDEMEKK